MGKQKKLELLRFYIILPSNCRATFDSVPVGSNVYLEANCFLPDGSWYYTGTSSAFTVEAGENTVTVKMKEKNGNVGNIAISLTSAAYRPDPISNPTNLVGIGGSDTTGNLIIDNDGFFELMTNDVSISKGKWRGSANQGGTLYLTEYIYSSIVPPSDLDIQSVELDKTIIVTSLSEIPVQIDSAGVFSFTLKNGAIISGNVGV